MKIEKRIRSTSKELAFNARVNSSYLLKDKKDKKKLTIHFALKFIINISCFDEEARGYAFHFVEVLSKNDLNLKSKSS